MKHLLTVFLSLLLAVQSFAQATSGGTDPGIPDAVLKEITLCLQEGNADRLSALFEERIEITMKEKREMYAREQAKFMLRQFFKDNLPSGFTLLHLGKAVENAYALGEYISKNGKRYKVNVFLNDHNGTFLIDHIRFEERDAVTAATQRVSRSIPQTGN